MQLKNAYAALGWKDEYRDELWKIVTEISPGIWMLIMSIGIYLKLRLGRQNGKGFLRRCRSRQAWLHCMRMKDYSIVC